MPVSGHDWPSAEPRQQALLIAAGLAMLSYGGYVLNRLRPRWLPAWLGALLTWGLLPKYLICARCENYGKACDFTWGGKYAAFFFPRQPDRSFGPSGALAEGVPGITVIFLPVLAARRKPLLLAGYLGLAALWQAVLIEVCCVKCVEYARDPWKARYCPSYRLASLVLRRGAARTDR